MFLIPVFFCCVIVIAGCHILIAEQEWSDNYALLNGTHSTIPEMIDGDYNTVGETQSSTTGPGRLYGSSNATEVIVTLPEKKLIRRIVVHSDNIKKLALYADKGGTIHSDTDWQLVKELKIVKSNPVVIPFLYTSPSDRFRLVVLDTYDDAALSRRANAEFMRESDRFDRESTRNSYGGNRQFYRRRYPARISEIEFFGYKSASETSAKKSDPKPEVDELDAILD